MLRFAVVHVTCYLVASIAVLGAAPAAYAGPVMKVDVDATDLPKRLLHARTTLPVQPGATALWYPKWVPGVHGPVGPIMNLGGLRVRANDGSPIEWSRNSEETYRFELDVPAGATSIEFDVDYICSQPTTNSQGVDSYGTPELGIINWNTCLLYPDGVSVHDLQVELTLRLPESWLFASALPVASRTGDTVVFEPRPYSEVLDSPLICGAYLQSIPLDKQSFRPAFLHVVAPGPTAAEIKPQVLEAYNRMLTEAGVLFGGAPFETYHFLLVCSDQLPSLGLEHLTSSLNGVDEKALADDDKLATWVGYLLPHEFVHAWCGKYRRPAGMVKTDYHTPCDLNLLWVYEGLTQHLGDLLCARSGLWTFENLVAHKSLEISGLKNAVGRAWRPLEDTAVGAWELRAASKSWSTMRRNQDYYREGSLLWLEVDAMLRQKSGGRKTLDDFCRAFFAVDKTSRSPFTLDDLCTALDELAAHDWRRFFDARVSSTLDKYPLEFVELLGYNLEYTSDLPANHKSDEKVSEYINAVDSLGVSIGKDGTLRNNLTPGMPAAEAGLAPGGVIQGVNGRKFSADRFREALRESVQRESIELLVFTGDTYKTVTIPYAQGERYLLLVHDKSKPDVLADIYAAKAK